MPWTVRVGPVSGVPLAEAADLLVPNPVSFIVQRLLIHGERDPRKKAQDVLYVHDTFELFGASLEALRAVWADAVRPPMPPKTARRAEKTAHDLFAAVTNTIREASRIPQDRHPLPEDIRAACHLGLEAVLGPW